MRYRGTNFFENFWRYIWPFLITIGVTGLCYLLMVIISFDDLREWIDDIMNGPAVFLFGSNEQGILIKSFWGFDIGDGFYHLFDHKDGLRLLFSPLILVAYVGGFVVGGVGQLGAIILGGLFVVIWFIVSFFIGTILELLIVGLPGIALVGYLVWELISIKNDGQESLVGENLVFASLILLQGGASVFYYILFAAAF